MKNEEKGQAKKIDKKLLWVSVALVLSALTITGIRLKNIGLRQNNYQLQMPGENGTNKDYSLNQNAGKVLLNENGISEKNLGYGELDYTPSEDSLVTGNQTSIVSRWKSEENKTNQAVTNNKSKKTAQTTKTAEQSLSLPENSEIEATLPQEETPTVQELPVMAEGKKLIRPVSGELIIPFNMEHTVYFKTLDQYKCSDAQYLSAVEGEEVLSCGPGVVSQIFEDQELGAVVVLDLGGGYVATYGQLKDIAVSQGQVLEEGQKLANVAQPSKYFSEEGPHLYFALKRNGEAVNPEAYY